MNLAVDVISDVICPWCYIGKRRLEKAIAALEGQHDVRVRWHPFQLNPTMPKEGVSRREYRIEKFGSWERSQELDAKVIAVGESEGIQFSFDKSERTPNTVDAHRGDRRCQFPLPANQLSLCAASSTEICHGAIEVRCSHSRTVCVLD